MQLSFTEKKSIRKNKGRISNTWSENKATIVSNPPITKLPAIVPLKICPIPPTITTKNERTKKNNCPNGSNGSCWFFKFQIKEYKK